MDNFVDERDYKILENEKCTFVKLREIIEKKCNLILSNHKSIIICFTCKPFPIWIWTADNMSEKEMENIYNIASEHNLLSGEYRFNLKYDLANFFIKRANEEGKKFSIITNMFAYECLDPISPTKIADGNIHKCDDNDTEDLVEFLISFNKEMGLEEKSPSDCRSDAELLINTGRMYFWKDTNGKNVTSCKYGVNKDLAYISFVFTRPEERRKHYAENLVYQVTKIIIAEGYIPTLYTDADYVASNTCYEKIGYILKGKLCTIG